MHPAVWCWASHGRRVPAVVAVHASAFPFFSVWRRRLGRPPGCSPLPTSQPAAALSSNGFFSAGLRLSSVVEAGGGGGWAPGDRGPPARLSREGSPLVRSLCASTATRFPRPNLSACQQVAVKPAAKTFWLSLRRHRPLRTAITANTYLSRGSACTQYAHSARGGPPTRGLPERRA